MGNRRKLWLVNQGLGVLITASFFLAVLISPLAASENPGQNLVEQVNQLVETCQSAEKFTVKHLQDAISRCDALSETVMESDELQKKLLIIRLKKSRNLCLYFLQLQQRE